MLVVEAIATARNMRRDSDVGTDEGDMDTWSTTTLVRHRPRASLAFWLLCLPVGVDVLEV